VKLVNNQFQRTTCSKSIGLPITIASLSEVTNQQLIASGSGSGNQHMKSGEILQSTSELPKIVVKHHQQVSFFAVLYHKLISDLLIGKILVLLCYKVKTRSKIEETRILS
jgi:hypothetical protein